MAKIYVSRSFVPKRQKTEYTPLEKLLVYAGIDESPEIWIGSKIFIALTIGIASTFLPVIISLLLNMDMGFGTAEKFNFPFMFAFMFLSGALFFGLYIFLSYMHLYFLIHDRTKRVESILPDFLLMISAHMHAGLTPFQAFQSAARPEFGPLEKEVKRIAARSMGSMSFTEALQELTEDIDSPTLRRTMGFFENGLKSGGKLANLLETAAGEIRELEDLRQQALLESQTYTIFLAFILVGGLPVLLAISTEFLLIFAHMQENLSTDALESAGSMLVPELNIEPDFVDKMAAVIIVGTSMFVSMFIGVLGEGKMLFGLKYWPPLAMLSYGVYFGVKTVMHGFLSAMF
jgi:archaeal flagellar protein FlaJ